MDSQVSLFDDNPEYDAFVAKFKPKKTTDDCYTPPLVYEAVKTWACKEYDIDPDGIVRPFYPGGDYEHYVYPSGCTVLDNPPFSILTKICEFYIQHNIRFFSLHRHSPRSAGKMFAAKSRILFATQILRMKMELWCGLRLSPTSAGM